ncbi:probable LARGE xylosyl- and glucuronyltransferase 2 [Coccomyxa sp. Obi]|nr:probable LARGE xylosyl- and glucuronyltransferase 2 [Coccomyxa sp. Obi]
MRRPSSSEDFTINGSSRATINTRQTSCTTKRVATAAIVVVVFLAAANMYIMSRQQSLLPDMQQFRGHATEAGSFDKVAGGTRVHLQVAKGTRGHSEEKHSGVEQDRRVAELAVSAATKLRKQGMMMRRGAVSHSGEEPPPAQPPPQPPKGALLRTELLLGPECGNMSADVLPQLKLEQSWKPGRFMRDLAHPASLVLQLPIERLDLLHLQCQAWTGRLAAVVYVPLMGKSVVSWNDMVDGSSMRDIFKVVSRFYDELDPMSSCELEMQLVSEQVASPFWAALPPTNALRNMALELANTEVVLLADVDVLPSLDLSADLLRPRKRSQMIQKLEEGNALVLPLLDVVAPSAEEGLELAKRLVTAGKRAAVRALREGQATIPDDGSPDQRSVRATNYTAWMKPDTDVAIDFEEGYEPVVLMLRKDVPWFDERFRGSDGGRVAQAADMARHLSFAMHRSAFAVRVPCSVPEQAISAAEAIYDQVLELYHDVQVSMAKQQYTPIARPACSIVKKDVYMDDSMSSGTDEAKGLIQLLSENSRTKQSQS